MTRQNKRCQITPAAYLILTKDNKIMLLRRFNTGYMDGNYCLIAGHVETSETFTKCIIREAKEETGIMVKPEDLTVVHVMYRDSATAENNNRIDVFFSARRWQGKPINRELNKCDDLQWFELYNLPKNIIPYIRQALMCAKENIFYSEHGW